MRISEVEKIVGISKKNIRFYEEEGLLHPSREANNGYRAYTEADIESLKRIRLLRRLAIPIEEIRKLREGRLTLQACMERHAIYLENEQRNLEYIKTVCAELAEAGATIDSIDIEACEERMHLLEEGGARFVKTDHTEARKARRKRAIFGAAVVSLFWFSLIVLFVWASIKDPVPLLLTVFLVTLFGSGIVGVLLALRERMKEIEKGEVDEAFKY